MINEDTTNHKMKIIALTEPGTGSTLVSNILTGFFENFLPISFIGPDTNLIDIIFKSNRITFKTHGNFKQSVAEQINQLLDQSFAEPLYFVYINRRLTYNEKHSQVIVLDYKNLLYKSDYNPQSNLTLRDVVKYVASCLENAIDIKINEEMIQSAQDRIIKMDELYEKIKNEPFKYYDEFYHIHGSHRNRKND